MASTRVLTGMVLVAAIAAAPVFADDGQHRHDGDRGRGRQEAQSAPRSEQAVPRAVAPQAYRDRRGRGCAAQQLSARATMTIWSGQPQQRRSSLHLFTPLLRNARISADGDRAATTSSRAS